MSQIYLKEPYRAIDDTQTNMSRLQLIGFMNKKVGHDPTRLIFDYDYTNTTKILVTDQIKYLIQEHKYLLCAAAKAAIERTMGPRAPPVDFHKYILEKNDDKLCTDRYIGEGAGRHGGDEMPFHDYLQTIPRRM